MLRSLFVTLLLTMSIVCRSTSAAEPAAVHADSKRPNILFIYADDQSYKTLGCYDSSPQWVRTPHIDGLARRGVRFERCYLGAWCMPSRASVLTGRLQHGIESMRMEGTYPRSVYDPQQCRFLPAEFRRQGYHTAQIGKWHTGIDTGYGRDWDYQIVWNRPGHPENAGNYYYDQILTFNGEDRLTPGYATDNYTPLAEEYIRGAHRVANKPWYLWLCYGAIHGPTTPADRHIGTYAGNKAEVPKDVFAPRPQKPAYLNQTQAWEPGPGGIPVMKSKARAKSNFDTIAPGQTLDSWVQQVNECMRGVDEGVGRVLSALKETGQLENTLVIYTADQGYALAEHGLNQKIAPYDASIASALIFAQPGVIPEGKVCRHPVNAPDLMNFICKSAHVDIPWKTHGRDISPLVKTPESAEWNSPMLFTHTGRKYGSDTAPIPTTDSEDLYIVGKTPWYVMLRQGKYKYIRTLVADETEELYDLDADPEELVNLVFQSAHEHQLNSLRQLAINELKRSDAPFADSMPSTRQRP